MGELLSVVTGLALFLWCAPVIWLRCDRSLTLERCPCASRVDAPRAVPRRQRHTEVDTAGAVAAVARSVRAGAEAGAAIAAAAKHSPELAGAATRVETGAPVADALAGDTATHAVLAACLHHGQFSAPALEDAAAQLRREQEELRESHTATAAARASTRMLTALPFGFLVVAMLLSRTVRSGVFTPAGLVLLVVGTALNRAGARWMARATARALVAGNEHSDTLRIGSFLAHHVQSGGDIFSALDLLSSRDDTCRHIHDALVRGAPLATALEPMRERSPALADAILAANSDGLPLLPALRTVVDTARHARTESVRAATSRLAARTTLPLVACVLPSFVLVALMPLVLAATDGHSTPVL